MNFECSFGEKEFNFQPSHPLYIKKPVVRLCTNKSPSSSAFIGDKGNCCHALEKCEGDKNETKKNYKRRENEKSKNPKTMNRLYSLPIELIEKIFEYDDTCKKYFEENVLCKTNKSGTYRRTKERNSYKFYQMILNNRGFNADHRKRYCQFIACGIVSSWFNDEKRIEYPFPYDLVNLNSRYISSVKVKKNIYEFKGEKFYFIRCEMEIIEFVKGLYKFLGEPDDDDFEVYFYSEWEDEYEVFTNTEWADTYEKITGEPPDYGVYEFLERQEYGKYKKIMLNGDTISELCHLILFADKNEQGKDVVYIQVDMDIERIEDELTDNTGLIVPINLIERQLRKVYDMRVYDVIQVSKEYLATHIFDK